MLEHQEIKFLPVDVVGVILLHMRRRKLAERNVCLALAHRWMPGRAMFLHKAFPFQHRRNPISSNTWTDDMTIDSPT